MRHYDELVAETTEEQLMAPVVEAKQRLAEAAANDADIEQLASLVNSVGQAWGRAQVAGMFVNAKQHTGPDHSHAEVINAIAMRVLSEGADDKWSGRRNDLARSIFDGKTEMVSELRWM